MTTPILCIAVSLCAVSYRVLYAQCVIYHWYTDLNEEVAGNKHFFSACTEFVNQCFD